MGTGANHKCHHSWPITVASSCLLLFDHFFSCCANRNCTNDCVVICNILFSLALSCSVVHCGMLNCVAYLDVAGN